MRLTTIASETGRRHRQTPLPKSDATAVALIALAMLMVFWLDRATADALCHRSPPLSRLDPVTAPGTFSRPQHPSGRTSAP